MIVLTPTLSLLSMRIATYFLALDSALRAMAQDCARRGAQDQVAHQQHCQGGLCADGAHAMVPHRNTLAEPHLGAVRGICPTNLCCAPYGPHTLTRTQYVIASSICPQLRYQLNSNIQPSQLPKCAHFHPIITTRPSTQPRSLVTSIHAQGMR
jgi:hypothetical protein